MTTSTKRLAALAIVPALVFTVGACSSNSDSNGGASASASASASPSAVTSYVTTALTAAQVTVTGKGADLSATFPHPAQAQTLSSKDITVGKAGKAKLNDTLTVNYYLASALTGKMIESSFSDQPATFKLAQGQLIEGWVKGIPGMMVGGRRVLVIPGAQAYGASPNPQSGIQPNETLVFVVDLVAIK